MYTRRFGRYGSSRLTTNQHDEAGYGFVCSVDEMGRMFGRQQETVDIYVFKLDLMLDVRPSMCI